MVIQSRPLDGLALRAACSCVTWWLRSLASKKQRLQWEHANILDAERTLGHYYWLESNRQMAFRSLFCIIINRGKILLYREIVVRLINLAGMVSNPF